MGSKNDQFLILIYIIFRKKNPNGTMRGKKPHVLFSYIRSHVAIHCYLPTVVDKVESVDVVQLVSVKGKYRMTGRLALHVGNACVLLDLLTIYLTVSICTYGLMNPARVVMNLYVSL